MSTRQNHITLKTQTAGFGKLICVLIIGFSFLPLAKAQEVTFETKLDSSSYLIGDYITLTLEGTAPDEGAIEWPQIADTILGLELIERGELKETTSQGQRALSQQITFIYFDSGKFVFPPLALNYAEDSTENAKSKQVESAAIPFTVGYAAIDSTGAPRPIKDRLDVSYRPFNAYLVYGLIALLALAAVIYFLSRQKAKPAPPAVARAKPKPTLPPYEHAMKRLAELEAQGLWQQDRQKLYHIELTDILREYIEGRFGYNTLEQTTPEILDNFKGKSELQSQAQGQLHTHNDNLKLLNETLQRADMVKFAKARLLPDEHQQSMRWTREFIERTKPAPQATAAAETEKA